MKEAELERIAEKVTEQVVVRLLKPEFQHALAEEIAKELQRLTTEYSSDLARLGERLDEQKF
jgi:hypothetical protein